MASILQMLGDFPRVCAHRTSLTRNEANHVQRLAIFLDRPGFPWKKLILGFSIGQYLFEGFLSLRQYQVLKQKKPPKTLENEITQEVFDKSQVCFSAAGYLRNSTYWL
jgi:hypothetical protein